MVPDGAKVTVEGLTLVGGGVCCVTAGAEATKLTVAVLVCVVSATLVAVIVTFRAIVMVDGAVYNPFTIVPTFGLSDQVAAELEEPRMVAVNCLGWPAVSETVFGFNEILTVLVTVGADEMAGPSKMVALLILVRSATLVAVIVTSESLLTVLGAVYNPLTIEPAPMRIDQTTCWLVVPPTVALNCADWPAYT